MREVGERFSCSLEVFILFFFSMCECVERKGGRDILVSARRPASASSAATAVRSSSTSATTTATSTSILVKERDRGERERGEKGGEREKVSITENTTSHSPQFRVLTKNTRKSVRVIMPYHVVSLV
jgi:hypothetical protein